MKFKRPAIFATRAKTVTDLKNVGSNTKDQVFGHLTSM